jgi:phage gp36-like protein
MFIEPSELKSAIYDYQLQQITDSDTEIVTMAILTAIEEVKSYLAPNNQTRWDDGRPRYDVAAIFAATNSNRNPLIVELCKSIAVYYITRLSNVDMLHERVKERYDRAISYLEKVSGTGKAAGAPALNPGLPTLTISDDEAKLTFRSESRTKFSHE